MNKLKLSIITAAALLAGCTCHAQEIALTNAPQLDVTKYDITLSAGGVIVPKTGDSANGLDLSVSLNPIKSLRNAWFGLSQSVAWEPFAGSTDLDIEWQIPVYKDTVFVLPAWSGGLMYDNESNPIWRTGPEVIVQWYVTDKSFFIVQGNYNLQSRGDSNFTWFAGIGIEF